MINLLPTSLKNEISQEKNLRVLIIIIILVFLFLLSLSFLLGSLRIYLGGEIKIEQSELITQRQILEKYEEKEVIKRLNLDILNTIRFYRKQIQLGVIFENIANDIPNSMTLENFNYTPPSEVVVKEEIKITPAKLTISGFAPTREILFSFRENLEADALFKSVNFPPLNWVNSVDIIYSVSLELES